MRLTAVLLVMCSASLAAAQDRTEAIPQPPAPVELRPATVRFRGNLEGLRVHYLADPILDDDEGGLVIRRVAEARYLHLCDTPCDRELPQGHFGLAVGRGERLVRFLEPLGVDGPTGVRLLWDDRAGVRLAGLLTLATGTPIGLGVALLPLAVEAAGSGFGDASVAGLAVGSALVVASVVIAVLLALSEDGASFSATPLPADASGLFSSDWE